MSLKPEDYGFRMSEVTPGDVEIRWRSEDWGIIAWLTAGISAFGFSVAILGSAPLLFPLIPLGFWWFRRRSRKEKSITLTSDLLILPNSSWPWNELTEVGSEQFFTGAGRTESGMKAALSQEQAARSFQVVVYRGPQRIVIAKNLAHRRAEYLAAMLLEYAEEAVGMHARETTTSSADAT